ncbi:MAG: riboflavin biosynthesis protein RibF [Christensenellaceae bacterium]
MQIVTKDTRFAGQNVIALGMFDGLHRAHRQILKQARQIARAEGMHSLVYTFSSLPSAYFGGEAEMLFSPEEKVRAVAAMEIDYLAMRPFDREIAEQSREEFARSLLERYRGGVWIAGYNFTFGRGAEGDADYLRAYAAAHGVQCCILQKMEQGGNAISSTRIRAAVRAGDMPLAEELLGRPYSIAGEIVHGREVGRKLGFPTANLYAAPGKLIPPLGVYIARLRLENGESYGGITNIGRRPTLHNGMDISVETNLLDFAGDLYGEQVEVELLEFVRPERPFSDLTELRAAIAANRRQAAAYFENAE